MKSGHMKITRPALLLTAPARAVTLNEAALTQGGFVLGRAAPGGTRLALDGKAVRVSPPKTKRATTPIAVETLVARDLVRTSFIERLTIWEKVARGIFGWFSRIRSKTMIVS